MPEVISKHPEITIRVLQGAEGVICGQGAEQRILTRCPPERFCATPVGEVCVYGLNQIPQMTQISKEDLAQVVIPPPLERQEPISEPVQVFGLGFYILIFLVLAVGVVLGVVLSQKWHTRK
jgi:hypothetical protein